ncbi:tryptophan-rich sensory protein [Rhizobium leguminosarum]|uniref:Tryptophan-rich sensory protein n=1 Tax=Rhizobium leguminosarum TaxID=384 RepID=A0A7X0DRR2_RHILE|nr:tryptophan-rich sensory protein [Rhizobium leguminosarum]
MLFVVILCLLALIVSFIAVSTDLTARLCFFPYALWDAFASLLNASLLWLNG